MANMGNMKSKLAELVTDAKEALNNMPDERLEASWLDAVPFDKDGNPTGEKNEWVIHVGSYVVVDGIETEREAEELLDIIAGEIEADMQEQVNDSGSMLSPDTITYCKTCHYTEDKEVNQCLNCGSTDVELIYE